MKLKILAAKILLTVVLMGGASIHFPVAQAGIPMIDAPNLIQNTIVALEAMDQTEKQIDQYSYQLKQYENQLKNTQTPDAYIWDQAQITINNLMDAADTLNYYKNQLGSLEAYLDMFKDSDYYYESPCFNSSNDCTNTERIALEEQQRLTNESQKIANQSLISAINQQQKSLRNDANQLQHLQSAAQGAEGQMQALGYANQFASQEINQLLQIRALLIAQQQALAIQAERQRDQEARDSAKERAMTGGTLQRITPKIF